MIAVIIIFIIIASWSIHRDRQRKEKEQEKQNYWHDYGPTTQILGHTFTKKDQGYEYQGLIWGQHHINGDWFGLSPGIAITQEEFFKRLEQL